MKLDLRRCLEVLNEVKDQFAEEKMAERDGIMWRRIFDKVDLISVTVFLIINCGITILTFFSVTIGLE